MYLLSENEKIDSLNQGEEGFVVFKKTPFYPTQGGEVADTGLIEGTEVKAEVQDVFKIGNTIFHKVKVNEGNLKAGDKVLLKVDEERRRAIERNHTATHIIQMALRKVIGEEVQQAGSLVSPDYLRFDFTISRKMTPEELNEVHRIVNEVVLRNLPVYKEEYSFEEAKKFPALHFFEEKYGDIVRIVSIGSKNPQEAISAEFCGGCHVRSTGEIGLIKIISQKALAQGVRRIEAITGFGVLEFMSGIEATLGRISEKLKTNVTGIEKRIEKLLEEAKSKKTEVSFSKNEVSKKVKEIRGIKFVVLEVTEGDIGIWSDRVSDFSKAVVFVYQRKEGKVSYAIKVPANYREKLHAGKLARVFASLSSTKAGGNEKFARGGGREEDFNKQDIEGVFLEAISQALVV